MPPISYHSGIMSVSTGSNHYSFNTKSDLTELSASWTIENASLRLIPFPRLLESPPIYSNDRSQKWHMCLSSQTISSTLYVDAYMRVHCADVVRAQFVLSVVDDEGVKTMIVESPSSEFTGSDSRGYGLIGNMTVHNLVTTQKWTAGDKITLHCEVKAIAVTSNRPKVRFSLPDIYLNKLSVLVDQKFTDVVLVFGNRELKAHKAMLAGHSSVFAAMFNSDMKECAENRVEIDDIDYEVVEQMLQFIYTDRAPKLKVMADRLLGAADKYDLERLKILCEQALCEQLSVDNAVHLLALANRHSADLLASHATEIVSNNIGEVMRTQDWHDMVAKFSETVSVQCDEECDEDKEDED